MTLYLHCVLKKVCLSNLWFSIFAKKMKQVATSNLELGMGGPRWCSSFQLGRFVKHFVILAKNVV